jgi:outer membrane protein assembly factor BamB
MYTRTTSRPTCEVHNACAARDSCCARPNISTATTVTVTTAVYAQVWKSAPLLRGDAAKVEQRAAAAATAARQQLPAGVSTSTAQTASSRSSSSAAAAVRAVDVVFDAASGTLYAGTDKGEVWCMDTSTPAQHWSVVTAGHYGSVQVCKCTA